MATDEGEVGTAAGPVATPTAGAGEAGAVGRADAAAPAPLARGFDAQAIAVEWEAGGTPAWLVNAAGGPDGRRARLPRADPWSPGTRVAALRPWTGTAAARSTCASPPTTAAPTTSAARISAGRERPGSMGEIRPGVAPFE